MSNILRDFVYDPENVDNNLRLAIYYDTLDQTASAVSYYLRTAERSSNDIVKYQSLLCAADCFDRQGCRNYTVKGLLQHAIAILPERPEGYYALSKFYEKEKNYNDSYLISSIGEKVSNRELKSLTLYTKYPGFYSILFQKALSAWWCGLCDESIKIFKDLNDNYDLNDRYTDLVKNNLKSKVSLLKNR